MYYGRMPEPSSRLENFGLADLIASFAFSVADVQLRLDQEWAHARDLFLQSLPPESREWRTLVAALAPARQVIAESTLDARYVMSRADSSETSVRVSLINLGFERKFAHSNFVRQTLTVRVVSDSQLKETSGAR